MECPTDPQIEAFVRGALEGGGVAQVESHLDECASCRALVAELSRADAPSASTWSGEIAHYELGPELARGGMGRIRAARDLRFSRRVAIKQLLRSSPGLRARFEREVRITARLQHPAIVPIYEAGQMPDGEPFYAMRLVQGRAFDAIVASRTTLDERLALLPALTAACDAIAYAHGEGVIHRDLKPANVLLGEHGETVVIDWGLAKDLSAAESDVGDDAVVTDPHATAAGAVLGTASYMPPEQASGGDVDARADVYALGALLYHAVAATPPYPPKGDVVAAVKAGPPRALAALVPDAPPALMAIIERAMARAIDARYPTAAALADDLKRFQTGQLVGAHRYSAMQLLGRFVARHKAAVVTGLVSLLVLVALTIAGIVRLRAERDRAERQRDSAEKLVGFVLGDLRDRLSAFGHLELLSGVGGEVQAYYDALPPPTRDRDRAAATLARARVLMTMGEVENAEGHGEAAVVLFTRAMGVIDGSAGNAEDELRAQALEDIGLCDVSLGKRAEALDSQSKARAMAEALVAREPIAKNRRQLVEIDVSLAQAQHLNGNEAGAADAVKAAERALAPIESEPSSREQRAQLLVRRADLERRSGTQGAAKLDLEEAIAVRKAIFADEPYDTMNRRTLGLVEKNLAQTQMMMGDAKAAGPSLDAAREVLSALVAQEPRNITWLRDVASVDDEKGRAALDRHALDEAQAAFESEAALYARILALAPGNPEWVSDSNAPRGALAEIASQRGQLDKAAALTRTSLESIERLVKSRPDNVEWQSDLAVEYSNLARFTMHRDPSAARDAIEKSLAIVREQAKKNDSPQATGLVAYTLVILSEAEARLHHMDAARAAQKESAELEASLRGKLDAEDLADLEEAKKAAAAVLRE